MTRAPLAVVTGASRGLGATLARFLAAEGFDLVLVARDAAALATIPTGPDEPPGPVSRIDGDVSESRTRERAREAVAARGGRLDLLINNASSLGPSPLPELAHVDPGALLEVYRVNVVAPVAWVQSLLPALAAARGTVVNISSDAARGGYPGWGVYGASKAALDLVTKTLAAELRDSGVSVLAVDPGDLRTAMHQAAYPGQDISDRPLPEVTLPFWAWLFHQDLAALSGRRFEAQSDRWEVPA